MWLRCFLVLLVVLWLVYEYTRPHWTTALTTMWTSYQSYGTYIKFGIGALVILLVLRLPSLETFARRHHGVYAILREFLVNDQYVGHFGADLGADDAVLSSNWTPTSSSSSPSSRAPPLPPPPLRPSFTSDAYARAQFRDGVKLSRGDANIPDEEQDKARRSEQRGHGTDGTDRKGTGNNIGKNTTGGFTTDVMLRQTAPDVRQKVVAAQGGLCVTCKRVLTGAEFVVVDRGAACVTCARVLGG